MDNANPFFQVSPRSGSRDDIDRSAERRRKGTIHVTRQPRENDKNWHGAAPTPLPETDKNWRPSEFRF